MTAKDPYLLGLWAQFDKFQSCLHFARKGIGGVGGGQLGPRNVGLLEVYYFFQFPYLSKSCYPIQPVSFHYSLSLLHTSKIFFGLRPLPLNRYEANFIQTALFRSSINNQTWQSFTHVFVQTAEIECLLKMKINQTNQFCQQIVVLM